MKSGVCYPYMNCAPGSRGGGNHCCPTGTVNCKNVSKEVALLESFKQESKPNYKPLICLVLPILLIHDLNECTAELIHVLLNAKSL